MGTAYSFYSKYCFALSSGVIFDDDERKDEKLEDFKRVCRAIKKELDIIQDDEGRRKFITQSSVLGKETKKRGEYKIYRFYVREVKYSYQDAAEMLEKVESDINTKEFTTYTDSDESACDYDE